MSESPPPPDALWPSPSGARWPEGAAIVQLALHPTLPWLTLACSNIERGTGAIVILNAASGALHGVYPMHDSLGSKYEPGQLWWHPDGRRLATHNDPSGITVLEDGVSGIDNYPDDARGEPVHFAWVDHRIYKPRAGSARGVRPVPRRGSVPRRRRAPLEPQRMVADWSDGRGVALA